MTDNQNDDPAQYRAKLAEHLITVTIFGNFAAKTMEVWDMTLPEIGQMIFSENRKRKNLLPWLKLAEFGDARTAKGSLRHDANVKWISGVEVDHDAGRPIADAIAQLTAAGIRALVYTSPSHMLPDEEGVRRAKWRVLAPTSGPLDPALRAGLTARLNGVLKGAAAAESFTLSQSYYFGSVDRNPEHQVEVIDGDFINLADDLDAGAIGSPGPAARARKQKAKTDSASPSYSDADIDRMLELCAREMRNPEMGWRTNMLAVTASLVGKMWTDEAIRQKCGPSCIDGEYDDDLTKLIDTARVTYDIPDPREDAEFAELLGQVEEDAAEAGLPPFQPAVVRADDKLKLTDFYAFVPQHQYILRHTGEMWIAAGVNAVLPKVKIGTKQVKRKKKDKEDADGPDEFDEVDELIPASLWLDWNRPVLQVSWMPGQPELIKGEVTLEGGLKPLEGATIFNMYQPPIRSGAGQAHLAGPWLDLVQTVYPDHWVHIVTFMAQRIQFPEVKINHALVMTGSPGIGKDTMLEPLKHGVGAWNFKEVSPQDIVSNNNDFMKSVSLRISEARDLGEVNKFKMYETMKTITAAPPDMVRVNVKYVPQYYLVNITGVIITTNYPTDGLYLPPTDRRHYVCGTEAHKDDFDDDYWTQLWKWYRAGGLDHVVAYLAARDLSGFDPKAPPVKTAAFWRMTDGSTAPEVAGIWDAIDRLGEKQEDGSMVPPTAITLEMVRQACAEDNEIGGLYSWLKNSANQKLIHHRFEACGYAPVRNTSRADGLWVIAGKRTVVYGMMSADLVARVAAATALCGVKKGKTVS